MKVNIVTGTKINLVIREIGVIKRMNQKGLILTSVAKIFKSWSIAQDIKCGYYRITKWR